MTTPRTENHLVTVYQFNTEIAQQTSEPTREGVEAIFGNIDGCRKICEIINTKFKN